MLATGDWGVASQHKEVCLTGFVWGTFLRVEVKNKSLHTSFDDRANAIEEIKDLIFLNGNGSERVVKYIHSECEKIRAGFISIENSNIILKPTFDLSDEDWRKYYSKLKKNDREFYTAYGQAQRIFNDFYIEIIELCGLEKIPLQQIKPIRTTAAPLINNDKAEQTTIGKTKPPKEKIAAPIIALFCFLINETMIVKFDNGSVETYCRKVCDKFDLPYTDRVRQVFRESETKGNIGKLKELILSKIDDNSHKILTDYFAKNNK